MSAFVQNGGVPEREEKVLRRLYTAINARNIDLALRSMHMGIEWEDELTAGGGRIRGQPEVSKYWRYRFRLLMNSRLQPLSFTEDDKGRVVVRLRWVVYDNLGEGPLANHEVTHVYTFHDGLIARMELGS